MARTDDGDFVEALLAAPVGVALLARLEAAQRDDVGWFTSPSSSDSRAVGRAVKALATMSFGRLLANALEAANQLAGPWMPDAPSEVAAAYRCADDRRALAEALVDRFGDELHGPHGLGPQEWWLSYDDDEWFSRPLFRRLGDVYGSGEFTWNGLWTVTAPPQETHDSLVGAWEMSRSPVSRWHLPVAPTARVWHIHRPGNWVELVGAFPLAATTAHGGWELPGPNQHPAEVRELLKVPGQNAVRTSIGPHLLPDWSAVADQHDGVHLSWAGFLTTEGFVSDLPGGAATMLRYWSSERTLWLSDAFEEPVPLPAPSLSGRVDDVVGIDLDRDANRRERDRWLMRTQLRR